MYFSLSLVPKSNKLSVYKSFFTILTRTVRIYYLEFDLDKFVIITLRISTLLLQVLVIVKTADTGRT